MIAKMIEKFDEWEENNIDTMNMTWIKNIYWKLSKFSCVLVQRNEKWFNDNIDQLKNIWSIIERERKEGFEHRAPNKRIKNEVKLLQKAESLNINVPKVFRADLNNGIIVMEYIQNSQTCREFILDLVKSNIDYNQVLTDLSVKIGRIIGNLHLNEIIHGDLTTSNILIVKEDNDLKIYFIDFGLSIVSKHLEDKAVDLYVLER